jgi:hypothetical protein
MRTGSLFPLWVGRGRLDHPLTRGGQVIDQLGSLEGQRLVVDHVAIGQIARRQHPTIGKAVELGGSPGLEMDHLFDGELGAAVAIPGPMGEHKGGQAGVAEHPAVGAAASCGQPPWPPRSYWSHR